MMRFDLRLHGRTASGRACRTDVSVYATSKNDLQKQVDTAARSAAWEASDPPHDRIPEGSHITIERVEKL
jgi:hypothetical protein